MKTVRTPKSWSKKLSRVAVAISMLLTSQGGQSQDGASTFGRTPFMGGSPSGSASEVVESNRDGFGMSFRGGHVAGDTVGRSESATHFNLSPFINIEDGLLFGDTRLLVANQGGLAWSFGGGYRHYIADWDVVIGGNSYIDQDQLTNVDLQQWGAGAELLANGWEARGNYYQTYGDTFGSNGSSIDQNSVAFLNRNITYTRIDSFAEGLRGWDSEIGFLLPGEISEKIDLRAFGGAYAYDSDRIDQFAGWSSRIQADIAKWLELGLKVTNDKVFDTTVSFNVAMHFGGFRSQEHTQRSAIQRFSEPVRRNLNIVTATTDVANPGQIARDPVTNQPIVVAHVNSNYNGPFNGTVNNPFNSLSAGLADNTADIVFVHAGSKFNDLPTVNLANGQKLYGEGFIDGGGRSVQNIIQTDIGQLNNLPSSPTFLASPALSRPILETSTGNAINLADRSEFSGFIINSPNGIGIFSDQAEDTIVNDVRILGAKGRGIFLTNTKGFTKIQNTIIENADGHAFHVSGGKGNVSFRSTQVNNSTKDSFAQIIDTDGSRAYVVLIEGMEKESIVNMFGSQVISSNADAADDRSGLGIRIQNNVGTVTIDNASIRDSRATGLNQEVGNGIAIVNSEGRYDFRNSIRLPENEQPVGGSNQSVEAGGPDINGTYISNAEGNSILVQGLKEDSSVNFNNVVIEERNGVGVRIVDSAGHVEFDNEGVNASGDQIVDSVKIMGARSGVGAAFEVTNSLATGSVRIDGDLNIGRYLDSGNDKRFAGSNGTGISLTGNASGSTFDVVRNTSIHTVIGDSIAIVADNSDVTFTGTTEIRNRGTALANTPTGRGIFVDSTNFDNSNASVEFVGNVNIQNEPDQTPNELIVGRARTSGLIVQGSKAPVSFRSLGITEIDGADAVQLLNNVNPDDHDAIIRLGRVTIGDTLNQNTADLTTIVDGRGIFAQNNDGIITTENSRVRVDGAAAIDISESGIDMTLQEVTSLNSTDVGIRLQNTNVTQDPARTLREGSQGIFTVTGDRFVNPNTGILDQNGSGGSIIDAPVAGVQLRNAGNVTLNQMDLTGNEIGVDAQNTIAGRDTTLPVDTDANDAARTFNNQSLVMHAMQIEGSIQQGVFGRNLKLFEMTDSFLEDSATSDDVTMIDLLYDTRLNTETTVLNPLPDGSFRPAPDDRRFDVYLTRNQITEDGGHAVLVRSELNEPDVNGALIFLEAKQNIIEVEANGLDAFNLDWNGWAQTRFLTNRITLSSSTEQTGFNVRKRGVNNYIATFDNNRITSTTAAAERHGLVVNAVGPSSLSVTANEFDFSNATTPSGMEFTLAENSDVTIQNNIINITGNANTATQGNGILFERVKAISNFTISGNVINNGNIEFRSVVGVIGLSGTQSNTVRLLNPNGSPFVISPGASFGQIIVNGQLLPAN